METFDLGQEVRIDHEGDKDDGLIGVVEEVNGTTYRVYFGPQDGGGWYDESELAAA